MRRFFSFPTAVCFAFVSFGLACAQPPAHEAPAANAASAEPEPGTNAEKARPAWAIAIHGGAGVLPDDAPDELVESYLDALREALEIGRDGLKRGDSSLEVVERVVRAMEDIPLFNAGKGAVFTADGGHELDAAIMDGSTLAAGAVTGVTTIKNPIILARLVMTETPHVFLSGAGAERFADEQDAETVERVEQAYFFTQRRHDAWQRRRAAAAKTPAGDEAAQGSKGTVGAVALDRHGDLAAATSTGGLTGKRFGRIGDTPMIGAGTYANNATCAVSGTGIGEQFIRHTVASDIAARMAHGGASLQQAAEAVIHEVLEPGDGGVIAVSRDGDLALEWNGDGMFRGAADANGRFEVAIWGDDE